MFTLTSISPNLLYVSSCVSFYNHTFFLLFQSLFTSNNNLQIRYDLLDCNICICSTTVSFEKLKFCGNLLFLCSNSNVFYSFEFLLYIYPHCLIFFFVSVFRFHSYLQTILITKPGTTLSEESSLMKRYIHVQVHFYWYKKRLKS